MGINEKYAFFSVDSIQYYTSLEHELSLLTMDLVLCFFKVNQQILWRRKWCDIARPPSQHLPLGPSG